ncbi:MAG: sigma-54 dependent transcriptional regulator [Planctomycetota bacterium]|nr:sigma-54 dependent transcriptional regulator [Planctomycetota bacterium]
MAGDRPKVLVVDDERSLLEMLEIMLSSHGFDVLTAQDAANALHILNAEKPGVVVEDIRMPGMDGLMLLKHIKEKNPFLPVIIITAYYTDQNTIEAMRLGAFDYIKKPFDIDHLRITVERALRYSEILSHRGEAYDIPQLVGVSEHMQEVLRFVRRIAVTDSTVLITGESGTGKELVARRIHLDSPRFNQPFITLNCAAFPETLLESELFGYKKGAFTGAIADKKGLFEVADQGTLFLDEISEIPLTTQAKLLRAIEEREFIPLGDTAPKRVNVRIITATNKHLEKEVEHGRFRKDLFYRLNVIPVEILPLRQRLDDIPALVGHFLKKYNARFGKSVEKIEDTALKRLQSYSWPGNVRELENVIQRAMALCEGNTLKSENIVLHSPPQKEEYVIPASFNLDSYQEETERGYIREALRRTEGNIQEAAALLGISVRSLRYKISKYRIADYKS